MSGLKSLFSGGAGAMAAAPQLTKPRAQRMPNETDPEVLAAADRTRRAAGKRRGRLSTIMTDNAGSVVGSSGKSLGA